MVKRFMRFFIFVGALLAAASAVCETPTSNLWRELKTKRETLTGFHQEFEAIRSVNSGRASQVSRHKVVIDVSQKKWREQSVGGDGNLVRIFNGQDFFVMEGEGSEFTRTGAKGNKEEPMPEPYGVVLEWGKAKEIARQPCGLSRNDHTCVILEAPLKGWMHLEVGGRTTRMSGSCRVSIDSETGLWLISQILEQVEGERGTYQLGLNYSLTGLSYSVPSADLFKIPETLHEVKELSPWNEVRIKKQLAGKPAPELEVRDIAGNAVSLSALKGRTILLDFWTTWCPPCLADASALDKLYHKYGEKELTIIGISVSEDRETVTKFLQKHPHGYPVVLTTENVMARPYQIGVFPTYIVVAPDGTLVTAEEGDQGFGRLRKILEKAGMETE